MPQPVMPKTWNWVILGRPIRLSRTKTNKQKNTDVLFILGYCNAKVGIQEIPEARDKFVLGLQNEAGQKLAEFFQENALVITKHPLPTTKEMTLYGHHWNQIDSILCSWRWRSSIQSAKTKPGSDHQFLIAKCRLKLKKVGKATKLFRYDIRQIPYDYMVEVTNRFKELDMRECLKNYGWMYLT